jgi:adhesin transport system membrane fusion protein
MLNISENRIPKSANLDSYGSCEQLKKNRLRKTTFYIISGILLVILISMFLPWTQNIQSKGYITTRSPQERPQGIQSVISGRIEKWYVQEGDFIEKGDTIVHISEVKSEYFDPNLIERTTEQKDAKKESIQSYDDKVQALKQQYEALQSTLILKRKQTANKIIQAQNKIKIDSIDLVAGMANLKIAENQLERTKSLYDKGLKSLSELQLKEIKFQEATAKLTLKENKLLNQRNELLNLKIEMIAIEKEYAEKLAKVKSDQQSALASKLQSVAETSKLENMLGNYNLRQGFYYLTAPQSGFITKTIKKGLGEIVKEGADIATIMPANFNLAAEVYFLPQDIPLLEIGNRVRMRFDGWPAIVIGGWPEASTGVFTGKIVAIDQFIGDNGYYRVLISPNGIDKSWPKELKVGTGVQSFVLLKDVPVWYEIWRQLNGFPPDYYKVTNKEKENIKLKNPIQSIK